MAELTNVLKMTFRTTDDKTVSFNVPDCKTDLTAAGIKECMNAMIVENIFSFDGGDLMTPTGAKIVKTESTDVF